MFNVSSNMNREQILSEIKNLACCQGFYGRLYQALTSGSEEAEAYLDELVGQNFSDSLDLVMYIEG